LAIRQAPENGLVKVELSHGVEAFLGPGARLAKIPESREVTRRNKAAPAATPEQLLRAARIYLGHSATEPLAHRFIDQAMGMIVPNPAITRAIESGAGTEVELSISGDIWDAVSDLFRNGGPNGKPLWI
jgi:hypothetical protein